MGPLITKGEYGPHLDSATPGPPQHAHQVNRHP